MFMEAECAREYRHSRLPTELREGRKNVEDELLDNRQRWATSTFHNEQRTNSWGRELHHCIGYREADKSIVKVTDNDGSELKRANSTAK
jgi:hypothetical protein